ncbi:AraC family transcriptional regulator [Nonomuraea sp. NPDC003804]|uniref:AraC family transcriptional regulator n=1 Tax=Nonomuraea sp. NPDC003804 TaxID=3154547 RepID=UPI0033B248B8
MDPALREHLRRLDLDLLMAGHADPVPAGWGRKARTDGYNRLYLILDGVGSITLDGVEYLPRPGQLYFLPAGSALAFSSSKERPLRKYWANFTATVAGRELASLVALPRVVEVEDSRAVREMFTRLLAAGRGATQVTGPLRQRAVLMELTAYLVDHAPLGSLRPLSQGPGRILEYIDAHLAEVLTVGRLAEVFHYNPTYFITYFAQLFGVSPNQYIRQLRVERVKQALIHTEQRIEEIAGAVGWEAAYLSRVFRQVTSLTPTQYRALHRAS